MPECQNCGNHVSMRYCRVNFEDDDVHEPPYCPACDNKVRWGDGS